MPHDPFKSMWDEALEMLEQAHRLHGRFFHPDGRARKAAWQPPMDLFESEQALHILIALPGVDPDTVSMIIDGGALVIGAERPLNFAGGALLRRLEIPYGRFERHIDLPPGLFALSERSWTNGCLALTLRKLHEAPHAGGEP